MADLKTQPTADSASKFIKAIPDKQLRQDCQAVSKIMQAATKSKPRMWGSSIVGFGTYHYTYASGRTGDWMLTGFSPRKKNLTLYIMAGFEGYEDLLAKLGKHSLGKSCLYVKSLADIDLAVLKKLVAASVKHMKRLHPAP